MADKPFEGAKGPDRRNEPGGAADAMTILQVEQLGHELRNEEVPS